MYSNDAVAARLAPGTRLNGIFEIERRIASGGMGEIYRGHAIETGDPVAIKVMRGDLADNATALALFRKEASALHLIHHEAIVRYYIFSNDPGIKRHYLAMEFVDGEPLSEILRRGPLPFDDVQLLQRRLASGLFAAHEHGIIHRDVSPDNIIFSGGNASRAKIIDFGIARSMRLGARTIIGPGFAGKYNYVSPEQVGLFGGEITAKSDIYSLGIVLAQCLTGRQLDMSGSEFQVIEKRRVVPDLGGLDDRYRPLIERMLQPDPEDRPASMAEVAAWRPTGESRDTATIALAARRAAATQVRSGAGTVRPAAPRRTARGDKVELAALVLLALLSCAGVAFYLANDSGGLQASKPPGVDPPRSDGQQAAAQQRAEEDRIRREAEAAAAAEAERQRQNREAQSKRAAEIKRDAEERTRRAAAAATAFERQRRESEAGQQREADERSQLAAAAAAAAEAQRERQQREAALNLEAEARASLAAALRRESEERARLEAQLKAEAEERARLQAAAEAERQRQEREAQLKREADARARVAATAAAFERQRRESEAAQQREADERSQLEAASARATEAERQRQEREAARQHEAEERARVEAQLWQEAERRAQLEARLKQQAEAAAGARPNANGNSAKPS
jgi:hypothetical protein